MAAQDLINILERTATGCTCTDRFIIWITNSDSFLLAQADLENARNFLAKAAEQNLPELLKQLSDILNTTTNNPTARTQAGKQIRARVLVHDDFTSCSIAT